MIDRACSGIATPWKLEGYLDGKLLVSGSDPGVAAGGIGVGTSDCTAQFDQITVEN